MTIATGHRASDFDTSAAVLEQHKVVRTQIGDRLQSMERGLALAVAASTAVAALGGLYDDDRAVLLLPFPLLAVFLYGAQQTIEIVSLGGYARLLESRLNALFDDPVWLWEQGLVKPIHTSPAGHILSLIYSLLVVASVGFSVAELWNQVSPFVLIPATSFIAATIAVTYLRIRRVTKNAFPDALRLYRHAVSAKNEPSTPATVASQDESQSAGRKP